MTSKEAYLKIQEFINDMQLGIKRSSLDIIEPLNIIRELTKEQAILEEYNVTPENIREVLLTGQMFRNKPTFEDCIKEWEERGWKTSYICDGINLSKLNDGIEEYFYFDKDLKRIDCNCFISFDLIPLIHKTLKALEVEND